MTVTLSLSFTPAETWSLNDRLSPMALHRKVSTIRQRAAMTYRMAGSPSLDRAACTCWATYPDRRARDAANYSGTAKAAIDGFVHPAGHKRRDVRGLLPDDSDAYLVGPDMRHDDVTVTPGRYTFEFVFEEVDHA